MKSTLSRLLFRAALLVGAWGCLPACANTAELPEITAYTDERPPYSFSAQGQVKGIAADLLTGACQDAGLLCRIQVVPWARGYAMALSRPNTLVFAAVRRPDREALFQWIGPIMPRSIWVWVRNDALQRTGGSTQLKDYRFGIVRGNASLPDLQAAGVPAGSISIESSQAALQRLLERGWIDAVIGTELAMNWTGRTARDSAAPMTRLTKLSDEGAYHYALSTKTDPRVVDRLQASIDKLRRNGSLDEIMKRYSQREPAATPLKP